MKDFRQRGKVSDVRSVRLYHEQWAWLEARAAEENGDRYRRQWTCGDVIRDLIDRARGAAVERSTSDAGAERSTVPAKPSLTKGRTWILGCSTCGSSHDLGLCPGLEGLNLHNLSAEIAREYPGWVVRRSSVNDDEGNVSWALSARFHPRKGDQGWRPEVEAEDVARLREKIAATGRVRERSTKRDPARKRVRERTQ